MPVWRRALSPMLTMEISFLTRRSPSPNSASADSGATPSSTDNERDQLTVKDLWDQLEKIKSIKNWAFNEKEVAVNHSNVSCNKKDNVTAPSTNGARTPIHANKIGQTEDANSQIRHYAAGQSPAPGSLDAILAQGIESGLGIYQFVSKKAHATGSDSREKTILAMLQERFDEQQITGKDFIVAGKYKILGFADREVSTGPYFQTLLTVEEINTESPNILTIPITQAGLKFTGAVLDPTNINMARLALHGHREMLTETNCRANTGQIDPLIISHAGIGRNATLITYDRICNLICSHDPDVRIHAGNLDDKLVELIAEGRASRGPRFLHSQQQLAALRTALLGQIAQWENNDPANRKNPVHFRTAHVGHNWRKRLSRAIPFKPFFSIAKTKPDS